MPQDIWKDCNQSESTDMLTCWLHDNILWGDRGDTMRGKGRRTYANNIIAAMTLLSSTNMGGSSGLCMQSTTGVEASSEARGPHSL